MGPVTLAALGGLHLVAPAPFFAARGLIAGQVGRKGVLRAAALKMLAEAETFGILDRDGELLVALLYWRHPDGLEEVSAWSRPAARLRPHLKSIVRLGRLTFGLRRQDGAMRFRALVYGDNPAGHKLAHGAGLWNRTEDAAAPEGFVVWENDA